MYTTLLAITAILGTHFYIGKGTVVNTKVCVLYMASDVWCDYAYYRIIPSLALYVDGC